MKIHEVANLFPMMNDEEFWALIDDIEKNGQQEPITVYNGEIIDGRNRYAACKELKIEPIVREWDGKGSLVSTVISLNLKRRHLTAGQRAAVAVDMLPLLEKEAKERQVKAGEVYGRGKEKVTEKIPEAIGESRTQAAKLVGTNERYVSDAKKIKQEAPEVFDMVKRGEANLQRAKALSSVPEEVRKQALENIPHATDGESSVCIYCGKLLPIDQFIPKNGTSKCKACRNKEINSKNKIKTEAIQFEGDASAEVEHLRVRVKELERRNKQLEDELREERKQRMVETTQLQGEIFVIKGNLTRSGIDYESIC